MEIKYRINSAEWGEFSTSNNPGIILNVTSFSEDDVEIKTFFYTVRKGDHESGSIGELLYNQVMEDPLQIKKTDFQMIIEGLLPVPEGHTLKEGVLYNDEVEKMRVRNLVNEKLDELYTGHVLAKAEKDAVYSANRKEMVDHLLEIENQPGFPYDVNFNLPEEDKKE
jgi:hypothetical protein